MKKIDSSPGPRLLQFCKHWDNRGSRAQQGEGGTGPDGGREGGGGGDGVDEHKKGLLNFLFKFKFPS